MTFISIIKQKIKNWFDNTLYYPGCLTRYAAPELMEKYEQILNKLGINFITLPEQEFCCGSPVIHAGYKPDFDMLVKKNKELFKKYSINKIITNCPACYFIFTKYYSPITVEHITQTIWINKNKLKIKKYDEISYHDPCHLGRHSNIYDEPRKILEKLGFTVVELEDNKQRSLCCGAGAGLKANNPDLANKIAKKRLLQCKTKKLVTPCPLCYKHLKENAKEIEVFELSEVIEI